MFSILKYLNKIFVAIFMLSVMLTIFLGYKLYKNYDKQGNDFTIYYGKDKATIHIDQNGVPHVVATTILCAYYALGYLHAKDRLWQIELERHIAAGRMSEIFGSYTLDLDKYMRTWGFYIAAKNDWNSFDKSTQEIIASYTKGINSYLARNKYPLELILLFHQPEKWEFYDSYVWGKVISWQQENIWQDKIINYLLFKKYGKNDYSIIFPPYPSNAPTTLNLNDFPSHNDKQAYQKLFSEINLDQKLILSLLQKNYQFSEFINVKNLPGKGSNAWVISGDMTTTGKPILANDVHLELSSPSPWYLVELQAPSFHVVGASLAGTPLILIGHNEQIAWGVTDAGIDTQEVYFLQNENNLISRVEKIYIRGKNPINYIVKSSSNGPLINNIVKIKNMNSAITVKWTGLNDKDTTIMSLLQLVNSKNWSEFKKSLSSFISPSLNFLYADTAGNIGYYLAGRVPIRKGWSGQFPVADDAYHQWRNYIPFAELPHAYNPKSNMFVSANNRSVSNGYKYSLTYRWREMPFRAERIIFLLKKNPKKISLQDNEIIQHDVQSNLWNVIKPYLLKIKPQNEVSKDALYQLEAWDGDMSVASVAATIFAAWYQEIKKLQPSAETDLYQMQNPFFIIHQLQTNGAYCYKQFNMPCDRMLSYTLDLSLKKFKKIYKNDIKNWQWGEIHQAIFKDLIFGKIPLINAIWSRHISSSGGNYTINMGAYNENFQQTGGASYRQIIDLSNLDRSEYMIVPGQSGRPFSHHYDDLITRWRDKKYLTIKLQYKASHKIPRER